MFCPVSAFSKFWAPLRPPFRHRHRHRHRHSPFTSPIPWEPSCLLTSRVQTLFPPYESSANRFHSFSTHSALHIPPIYAFSSSTSRLDIHRLPSTQKQQQQQQQKFKTKMKPRPSSPPPLPDTSNSTTAPDCRTLRSHYRRLKALISEEKEALLRDDSSSFDDIVRRADDLHSLVNRPREQIADAEALLDITEAFLNLVKESRRGGGIKASDFVAASIHKYGKPYNLQEEGTIQLDWDALGLEAVTIFHDAPGMRTMLGPMDSESKKRKACVPRQRREKSRATDLARPQEIEDDAEEKSSETDKNIRVMFNVLRKHGENGCELEHLVLNRDSFSETVENVFFLSFLVKDGRAGIVIKEGKQIVEFKYAPTAAERSGKSNGGQVVNSQFVFRLDYKDWMAMKEMVAVGEELMPKRDKHNNVSASSATPIRKNTRNRGRVTIPETGDISIESGHCENSQGTNDADLQKGRHQVKKRLI